MCLYYISFHFQTFWLESMFKIHSAKHISIPLPGTSSRDINIPVGFLSDVYLIISRHPTSKNAEVEIQGPLQNCGSVAYKGNWKTVLKLHGSLFYTLRLIIA